MTKMVIAHKVADVEHWLKFHGERVEQLAGFGSGVTEHVASDGSNNVALTMDVNDMDAMQAVISAPTPDMAAAMEKHGVIPPLSVYTEK
jgi:hypothetical protein